MVPRNNFPAGSEEHIRRDSTGSDITAGDTASGRKKPPKADNCGERLFTGDELVLLCGKKPHSGKSQKCKDTSRLCECVFYFYGVVDIFRFRRNHVNNEGKIKASSSLIVNKKGSDINICRYFGISLVCCFRFNNKLLRDSTSAFCLFLKGDQK